MKEVGIITWYRCDFFYQNMRTFKTKDTSINIHKFIAAKSILYFAFYKLQVLSPEYSAAFTRIDLNI